MILSRLPKNKWKKAVTFSNVPLAVRISPLCLCVCVCACMYGAGSLGVEGSREMTGSDLKEYPGLGRAYINIQLQLCTSYQYIGGARSLKCYLKDEQQLAR